MSEGKYPEPVVGAFIFNKNNQLFLMKSHKWSNLWVVPGGHIEIGETIENALKREVKEETNLEIINPQFICLWQFIQESEYQDKRHMLFLNYRTESVSSEVKLNSEAQEFVWVSQNDALKLPLEKYTRMTIEQFGEKLFIPQSLSAK